MKDFDPRELKKLYIPPPASHKGQNGKLMIIGGSHLFHAASLWALTIASRIVDMVFYSSVPENNEIVEEAKREFRNGIVVPRDSIDDYISEADCVLIGPGMLRAERAVSNFQFPVSNLKEINNLADEGEQSYYLTKYLLEKYPRKKWVIDAGALQMMEPEWLKRLNGNVVITPHPKEYEGLESGIKNHELWKKLKSNKLEERVMIFSKEFNCTVLLKGEEDLACWPFGSAQGGIRCIRIPGGNAGMTKGGTGDVLAGLIAGLACKNDLREAAVAGSYINKKAGEALFEKVGYFFNASDLADEIPRTMSSLLNDGHS